MDTQSIKSELDQAFDLLEDDGPLKSTKKQSRGTSTTPGDASTLQVVNQDGVLKVVGFGSTPSVGLTGRRGTFGKKRQENLAYERPFEILKQSEIGLALQKLDNKLTPINGLRELTEEGQQPVVGAVPDDGKFLLIVHGTFSKSEVLLEGVGKTPEGEQFLGWARGHYSHIYTFDNPTLSVSPILNARNLATIFSKTKASIDVICHSRGGLVTRWWLEVFDNAPPQKRRAIFVACPLHGTGLAAAPNLRGSLSLLMNIGTTLGAASTGLVFVTVMGGVFNIVSSVTKGAMTALALDAALRLVPGLSAQSRLDNNEELNSLRNNENINLGNYFAVISNFESEEPEWKFSKIFTQLGDVAKDKLADVVFKGPNDLMVDTASMTSLTRELEIPRDNVYDFGTTATVHHTNYFEQPETMAFLKQVLG